MKATVTFHIDTDQLASFTDEYIAVLWYVTQGNPAPIDDLDAGQIAEYVAREIVRRWVRQVGPPLLEHQGAHAARYCPAGEAIL